MMHTDEKRESPIITWRKACKCKNATAGINRFIDESYTDRTGAYVRKVIFYASPVCNKCNKPWKLIFS
jgi:hypothetical protein